MKDRVIAYLAQGFPHDKVVAMCGCTLAYVAQVETACVKEIEAEKKKHDVREAELALDQRYMKLEGKVITALEQNLPYAEFGDLTKAMGLLIQKRQKIPTAPSGIVHDNRTQVVVLQLPQSAVPELTFNERKEVIAVGGRALAALPSSSVRELFERLGEQRKEKLVEAQLDIAEQVTEDTMPVLHSLPDDF